jgi:hypothetical protein
MRARSPVVVKFTHGDVVLSQQGAKAVVLAPVLDARGALLYEVLPDPYGTPTRWPAASILQRLALVAYRVHGTRGEVCVAVVAAGNTRQATQMFQTKYPGVPVGHVELITP